MIGKAERYYRDQYKDKTCRYTFSISEGTKDFEQDQKRV